MTGEYAIEDDLRKITRLLRQLRSKLRGLTNATDAAPSVLYTSSSSAAIQDKAQSCRIDDHFELGEQDGRMRTRMNLSRTIKYTRKQNRDIPALVQKQRPVDLSFPTPIKKPALSLLSSFQAAIEKLSPSGLIDCNEQEEINPATGQILSLRSLAAFAVGRLVCAARDGDEEEEDSFATDEDWYEVIPSHLRRSVLFEHVIQILIRQSLIPTMIPALVETCVSHSAYTQGFELLRHYWSLLTNHTLNDISWSISEANKLKRGTEWIYYLARWILRSSWDRTRLFQALSSMNSLPASNLSSAILITSQQFALQLTSELEPRAVSETVRTILLYWYCKDPAQLANYSESESSWVSRIESVFHRFWECGSPDGIQKAFLLPGHMFLLGLLLFHFAPKMEILDSDSICERLEFLLMNESVQIERVLTPKTIYAFMKTLEILQTRHYISLTAALAASLLNAISDLDRETFHPDIVQEIRHILDEIQTEFESTLVYLWIFEPVLGQWIPQADLKTNSSTQPLPCRSKSTIITTQAKKTHRAGIVIGKDPLFSSSPVRGLAPLSQKTSLADTPSVSIVPISSPPLHIPMSSPLSTLVSPHVEECHDTPKPRTKRVFIEDFDPIVTPIPKRVQKQLLQTSQRLYREKQQHMVRQPDVTLNSKSDPSMTLSYPVPSQGKENVRHSYQQDDERIRKKQRKSESRGISNPTRNQPNQQVDTLHQHHLPSDLDDLLFL